MGSKKLDDQGIKDNQQYDTAAKAMLKEHAPELISLLLPGTVYQETLDIEVMRSNLRMDRAYAVLYGEEPHNLQLEFQTGVDTRIIRRLLAYHTSLWYDYEKPVLSVVVYLFPCAVPKMPFKEENQDGVILAFYFQVICLWMQDARTYITKKVVSIYPWLPAMANVNSQVLLQAIDELVEYYKAKKDTPQLIRQLLWFGVFLRRSETVSNAEKRKVAKRLDTFEYLLEHDPYLQERDQRNMVKGEQIGKLKEAQNILLVVLSVRFPNLYTFAEPLVFHSERIDVLNDAIKFIATADEITARDYLATKLSL
jgi:hypothetical protein